MSQEGSAAHSLTVSAPSHLTTVSTANRANVGAAEADKSALSLSFLWYVVRRWGKLAFPLGILTMAAAAALILYLFEPKYRAEALMQIKKQRPMVAVKIDDDVSNEFVATQKQLLKSGPVLTKVLAKPEIARMPELRRADDPKKWIEKNLEVTAVVGSELFTVAYQGPNAENARLVVDAVVQAYFSIQEKQNNYQITNLLDALKSVKDQQIENVKHIEKSLQEAAKKYSGDSAVVMGPNATNVIEVSSALSDLLRRLSDAEAQRQVTEIQIKVLEGQEALSPPSEGDLEQAIDNSIEVGGLNQRISILRTDLQKLEPGTAVYRRIEREIKNHELQRAEARRNVRTQLVKENDEQQSFATHGKLASMKALLTEYQLRENTLRSRLEEERQKIEGTAGNRYELEFLRNDLARAKDVTDKIEDRIFGLTIEYLSPQRPEQVEIIHPAEAPRTPVEAYPLRPLAVCCLAGLLFPFVAFGAFELLSRRLYQSDQFKDHFQLTLVGEISVLPSRPLLSYRGAVRRYLRDRAIYTESVESLRSILTVSPEWADAQVLGVASAVSGEGKTSLTSQLAIGWSHHAESRTLIIDCDIRDPDLHSIFGVANSPGLVEVLSCGCELNAAIVHWDDKLDILPAGTLVASPHRVFAGQGFAELVSKLREQYSRIIVDVPPLLSASEVLSVLKAVDGVLLCARRDHSRAPQVKLARERLEKAGIQRIGGVFGGVSSHSYAYQYGEYAG